MSKPLDPTLPGRYGRMTKRQMDAVWASLDRPIPDSEMRGMTTAERAQWNRAKRRPGRPRRGKGVRVISLSIEEGLLERADRQARASGMSRAALFEKGLLEVLAHPRKLAG